MPSDGQYQVDLSQTTRAQSLCEGLASLDLATIKYFLRFIASVGDERIDQESKLVTADFVNTFAECFFFRFARVTHTRIEEEDRKAVYSVKASHTEPSYWLKRRTLVGEAYIVALSYSADASPGLILLRLLGSGS